MIASSVAIFELSGQKRSLVLAGPSLPFRGTTWGSETRLKTKFVNGNPEAVQHVLGPAEMPTDFEGMWRTTQLIGTPAQYFDGPGASPQAISRASTLMQAFEGIARGGSLLRVVWSSDDGRSILREGRIGPISFPIDRFDDIKWKCTFQWIGRGASSSKVVFFKGESTDANVVQAMHALTDVLGTIAAAAFRSSDPTNALSATNASLGTLERLSPTFSQPSLVTGVGAFVSVGFGFGASAGFGFGTNSGFGLGVSSSSRFGSSSGFMSGITASVQVTVAGIQSSIVATQAYQANPAELAAEAAQVGRSATRQLNATADLLGQIPPELFSAVPTPSAVALAAAYVATTAKAIATAEKAAMTLARVARQRMSASNVAVARVDRASANDAVKVIRSSAGDTFASISLVEYGTPDQGPVIARANGFPSFRVAPGPGVRLVIPALTSANQQAKSA